MKIRIQPYKRWSGGARALGKRCGILRATPRQVERHGDFDTIINWGNSERKFNGNYINEPEKVAAASNKLTTSETLGAAYVDQPAFTTDRAVAEAWINEGSQVVCRTLLRGAAGRGIVLADTIAGIARAPLYTKYFKKADEYRVHVVRGQAIDVQQKLKRQEVDNDDVNYQIRNADNGWVYCRGGVTAPACVINNSVRAVGVLGLDFGAVDVGYNRYGEECAVFEVNTAPGLEGTTLDKYYDAFRLFLPIAGGIYGQRRRGERLGKRRL